MTLPAVHLRASPLPRPRHRKGGGKEEATKDSTAVIPAFKGLLIPSLPTHTPRLHTSPATLFSHPTRDGRGMAERGQPMPFFIFVPKRTREEGERVPIGRVGEAIRLKGPKGRRSQLESRRPEEGSRRNQLSGGGGEGGRRCSLSHAAWGESEDGGKRGPVEPLSPSTSPLPLSAATPPGTSTFEHSSS